MEIRKSFSKRANTYDEQSFIQQDVNKRLLNRLRLIKHSQSNVLEIGSGTGKLSCDIINEYPDVNLISMDLSLEMLKKHKLKNPETNCLVGNAENPPRFTKSAGKVLTNMKSASFEPHAIAELIFQSNRSLEPLLTWDTDSRVSFEYKAKCAEETERLSAKYTSLLPTEIDKMVRKAVRYHDFAHFSYTSLSGSPTALRKRVKKK